MHNDNNPRRRPPRSILNKENPTKQTIMKPTDYLIIFVLALLHCTQAFVPLYTTTTKAQTSLKVDDVTTGTVLAAYKNSKTTSNGSNKVSNKSKGLSGDDDEKGGVFSKPANLIFLPLVAIFGLDLVLNILVVVKRSIEVALTGQYTCTGPWC